MQKSEIKLGEEYLLREARSPDTAIQRVRVLQHVRGKKWKAEWIEPNPGLVDYVESQNLLVRWKDRKAYLQDEERDRRLREHNEQVGYVKESPITRAVEEVFESMGDEVSVYRGILKGSPEAIQRVKQRAKVDEAKTSPYTYVDGQGTFHAPFDEALELAKAFCEAEPSTVLIDVEATEGKWSQEASRPDGEYVVSLLNEYRAAWALIRQWTGHDPAIAQREARIQRLERLVWDAIYALQKAGNDREADRLRRAMERG